MADPLIFWVLDKCYLLGEASSDHFLAHSHSRYERSKWFIDLVVYFCIESLYPLGFKYHEGGTSACSYHSVLPGHHKDEA